MPVYNTRFPVAGVYSSGSVECLSLSNSISWMISITIFYSYCCFAPYWDYWTVCVLSPNSLLTLVSELVKPLYTSNITKQLSLLCVVPDHRWVIVSEWSAPFYKIDPLIQRANSIQQRTFCWFCGRTGPLTDWDMSLIGKCELINDSHLHGWTHIGHAQACLALPLPTALKWDRMSQQSYKISFPNPVFQTTRTGLCRNFGKQNIPVNCSL